MVHIFEVSTKITALGESLVAEGASEWSLAGVLSEVVSQITAFLENTVTSGILAFEEQLNALCVLVLHFNCLMPLHWNTSKGLRLEVLLMF